MSALRILTINTGKCDGPYQQRLEWLANELQSQQADVIACQEAFRDETGRLDTAGMLAKRLGMHLAWTPARFKRRVCEGREVGGWSGMAMLSLHPFTMVDAVELPADERDGERRAQVGLIEVEESTLVIANLHLTHLRDKDALRAEQLRRVLSHPLMGMKRAWRLICGDFNATPDGPLFSSLQEKMSAGHLSDAYVSGSGASQRATLPSGRCVDYVLSLAEDNLGHPTFTSSAVVLNRPEPETGILPSDHFGLATTMMTLPIRNWLDVRRASFAS